MRCAWHLAPVSIPTTGAATEPAECGTWRPAIACRSSRATDEIFPAAFNYEGDTIITGSKARTRTRHGLTARLKPFLLPLAGQHVPHPEELNGLGAGEKIK